MQIVKERTRLIISEYSPGDKKEIENKVAAMDNIFMYVDPDKDIICVPTGMENTLKQMFPDTKFIDNSDEYWDYARITPVSHNAKPRNQLQIDFINFVIEKAKNKEKLAGILSPGTGKTFMSCYSAIIVGARTLIIAPTSSIKDQWEETLVKMFKVPAARVLNVKSPKDFFRVTADFVVISQASLQSLNKTYDLERIIKDNKFGIKIIDEVQMWFKNIINVDASSNIAHNWYLTGTFGRSGDDENRLYHEMFGDLAIFEEKQKKATIWNPKPGNVYGMKPYIYTTMIWTHAGLSQKDIKEVTNSMRYSEREGKWVRYGISMPAYTNKIIPPDGRKTKYIQILLNIVQRSYKEVKYGRTLILVGTIAATEVIAKYVSKLFPDKKVGTYHSENTKELNAKNKLECDIVVSTTQSAGTGFDMKDLSRLILSANMKSWILATQCVGRLRRRPDGKDCYCWDIVDADIKQLRAWAKVRAETVRKMSKKFTVVNYDI